MSCVEQDSSFAGTNRSTYCQNSSIVRLTDSHNLHIQTSVHIDAKETKFTSKFQMVLHECYCMLLGAQKNPKSGHQVPYSEMNHKKYTSPQFKHHEESPKENKTKFYDLELHGIVWFSF